MFSCKVRRTFTMVQVSKTELLSNFRSGCVMFTYKKYKFFLRRHPRKLLDIERSADAAVELSKNMNVPSQFDIRQLMINKLRQFYNLEFKLVCHKCGEPHYQDEITAPER